MTTRKIEDLVGQLSIEEQALDLKYQMKLRELQDWQGDDLSGLRMPGQHYIQITGEDYQNAYVFALARTIQNVRDGIADIFKGGTDNAVEGDIIGMLIEICVANQFQTDWDHNIVFEESEKWDMKIHGKTIDNKGCLRRNNWTDEVVVHQGKVLGDSSYYFFAKMISNTTINLYGWASENEIIKDVNKKKGRSGYWFSKYRLSQFEIKGE
jgi:hypothetical protein